MSALEGRLINWIEQREADDIRPVRIAVRLPDIMAGDAWTFVNAIIKAVATVHGTDSNGQVGVSSTARADDVSFTLNDGTVGHVYIVCGDEYVL